MLAFCYQTVRANAEPVVSTDKDTYKHGEIIKVNFANAPGNDADWICIVPSGSPDTEGGDYQYLPKGLNKGSLTFDPPVPGKYEVRAYYDYSRNGYIVSGRHSFIVTSNPDYEREIALRMERKIAPNNPLEANVPADRGIVYICREPRNITSLVDVPIKANGKDVVIMKDASFFIFSVPAGDINFSTGVLTERRVKIGRDDPIADFAEKMGNVINVRPSELTIKVKPGYAYYVKLSVSGGGGFNGTSLDAMPYEEGADLIDKYKLTMLK